MAVGPSTRGDPGGECKFATRGWVGGCKAPARARLSRPLIRLRGTVRETDAAFVVHLFAYEQTSLLSVLSVFCLFSSSL